MPEIMLPLYMMKTGERTIMQFRQDLPAAGTIVPARWLSLDAAQGQNCAKTCWPGNPKYLKLDLMTI
jgi:hypothetical protein